MGTTEWIVVVAVVGGRLVLPLLIPYFPVPALLACLILDSIDQSIFQQFPAIPLDGYQSYDKALDVYYLSVAYLSTLRNWTNQGAFRMSQFLYYYRMVGVIIFEMTQNRTILFIFPNTFEYFFLFVEAVRLGWNTKHMGTKTVVLSAAAIWIFIKLPQEWWIHIAQLDMTDFIKETLFGVDATDSWSTAIANRPWVLVLAIVARARHHRHRLLDHQEEGPAVRPQAQAQGRPAAAAAARRGALPQGPRRDQHLRLGAAREGRAHGHRLRDLRPHAHRAERRARCASSIGVAIFTVINAAVSHWMALRGRSWRLLAGELVTMLIVNLVIVLVLEALERWLGVKQRTDAVRHDAVLLVPADAGHRAVRPLPHGVQGAAAVPGRGEGRRRRAVAAGRRHSRYRPRGGAGLSRRLPPALPTRPDAR